MRTYCLEYDTGHDYGSIHFTSSHRAGSKANREDGWRELLSTLGRHSRNYEIVRIYRDEM